jgi:dihydroxycyclohexadiene carboxylate dehydrogenase
MHPDKSRPVSIMRNFLQAAAIREMMNTKRFDSKVVIVTGAAQGIGRGVALAAAAEGALPVLADRSERDPRSCAEIASSGGKAVTVLADLETYAGAQAVMQAAIDAHGRIDVLINNVGGTIWAKPFQEYEEQQIEAEIRRSLFPTLWCCRAVLPFMIERARGDRQCLVGCNARHLPYPVSAAKGGVNALTASLAFEHAAKASASMRSPLAVPKRRRARCRATRIR